MVGDGDGDGVGGVNSIEDMPKCRVGILWPCTTS